MTIEAESLSQDQIYKVRRRLLEWGRNNFVLYPWRIESDAWLTFVAELFLQRTQARQVKGVFEEFRSHYPTPTDLLNADIKEVSRLTRKLGLNFRLAVARDIATFVVRHNRGVLPEDVNELTKLKGVGTYTASAWLSLHRGKRAVLVDSNVARWLSRLTGNPYNRDPRGVSWLQELAERMTPVRSFKAYNYAVLDFTMNVCTPRTPDCTRCPIRANCRFGSKFRD